MLYATVGLITLAALAHLYEISPVGAIVGGLVLVAGLTVYIVWQVRRQPPDFCTGIHARRGFCSTRWSGARLTTVSW